VDDLAPSLREHSRAQVMQALQNAKTEGWLECTPGRGLGDGKGGKQPGTFTVAKKPRSPRVRIRDQRNYEPQQVASEWKKTPPMPRVNSVFELGAAMASNDTNRRAA
jgi:hypothetical protein